MKRWGRGTAMRERFLFFIFNKSERELNKGKERWKCVETTNLTRQYLGKLKKFSSISAFSLYIIIDEAIWTLKQFWRIALSFIKWKTRSRVLILLFFFGEYTCSYSHTAFMSSFLFLFLSFSKFYLKFKICSRFFGQWSMKGSFVSVLAKDL